MDLVEKKANANRHPWELSRGNCILNIVKKYNLRALVDIGAGDRFFISQLAPFISGKVYAIDKGYDEKIKFIDGIFCLNDIAELPELTGKNGGGGGIILMDVLEHVQSDTEFLKKALAKLPDGGLIFITVPSFQFLFSEHDVFLKHYRRYDRKQLLGLLNVHDLYIERCHYFYASLFLARLASLILKKGKPTKQQSGIGEWRLPEGNIITRLIYTILNFDFYVCAFFARFHIYLPGLSLLAVCRKQGRSGV